MSEYNKELCEERQVRRNKEIEDMKAVDEDHENRLTEMEKAVLILTKLREDESAKKAEQEKKEKFQQGVTIALCSVIVVLAFGKEIAVALIAALLK